MWLPDKMSHFILAVEQDQLEGTLQFIGEEGKFHLTEIDEEDLKKPDIEDTYRALQNKQDEINEIVEYFEIEAESTIPKAIKPVNVLKESKAFLTKFNRKFGEKKAQLKELEEKEVNLNIVAELLSLLPETDIAIENLFKGEHFNMVGGTVPAGEAETLQEIKETSDIYIESKSPMEEVIPVLIFYPQQAQDKFNKITDRIRFQPLERFHNMQGKVEDFQESIEIDFWEIKEQKAGLRSDIQELGQEIKKEVVDLQGQIKLALRELNWIKKMGRSNNVYLIDAYLPQKVAGEMQDRIENEDIHIIKQNEVNRCQEEAAEAPVKLNNPWFVRPFEMIVNTYGLPAYNGFDPTFLTMLTFLIMFGVMFGDLGHGLVLTLSGVGICFNRQLRKIGYILVSVGAASSIFGVLFGEFFGMHLFHPIWFSPIEQTQQAMLFAAIFGVIMLSIGFISKIIEGVISKNYKAVFLKGEGLPGFIFYLSLIGFVYIMMTNGSKNLIYIISTILVLSVLTIAMAHPIKQAITGKIKGETVLDSVVELIHLSLAVVSNTLSFVRVAAFNIAHVILTMSVIRIAETVGGLSSAGQISMLIIGHLTVIILEAMIVFIQTLRLEYYEFYSRFFKIGNVEYEPVNLSKEKR